MYTFHYQKVIPVLKWVRGDPLSQDHWLELFRMVRMKNTTTLENLCFGDILDSADAIIENAEPLKVSSSISCVINISLSSFIYNIT